MAQIFMITLHAPVTTITQLAGYVIHECHNAFLGTRFIGGWGEKDKYEVLQDLINKKTCLTLLVYVLYEYDPVRRIVIVMTKQIYNH